MPRTPPSGLFSVETTVPPTPSPQAQLVHPVPIRQRPSFFSPYGDKAKLMEKARQALRAELELYKEDGLTYHDALSAQYSVETGIVKHWIIFPNEFVEMANVRSMLLQEFNVRVFAETLQDIPTTEQGEIAGPSAPGR